MGRNSAKKVTSGKKNCHNRNKGEVTLPQ